MNKPDLKSPLGKDKPEPKADKDSDKKKAEASEPIELVHLATNMWWAVSALQIIYGILLGAIIPQKPRFIAEQLQKADFDRTLAQSGLSEGQMLGSMGVIIALMFIVFAVIFGLFTLLVRKGKGWPRWILIGGSLYLAVSALQLFFSTPDVSSRWFVWGAGITMILSGLLAVVASYVITRPELSEFFGDPKDFDEKGDKANKKDPSSNNDSSAPRS